MAVEDVAGRFTDHMTDHMASNLHGLQTASKKKPAVSSGFSNGASRTRTGDLLGAIQNPWFPRSAVISTDWPCLQDFS
jgi:hypothetical protein